MSDLDGWVREILRCPVCHGELTDGTSGIDAAGSADGAGSAGSAAELVCEACALAYPVRDGIPVLLVTDARPLR